MSKNDKQTSLDYTNAITDSHNESSKALNVVDVSSLVPVRYGKIEVEYVKSGNGVGKVDIARYYSNGIYQETRVSCREDFTGSTHKTILNFTNKDVSSLNGKSFILDDGTGYVLIWFNVDFLATKPVNSDTYRDIEINLLSTHNKNTLLSRIVQNINLDSYFFSQFNESIIIISNSSVGIRKETIDIDTDLNIKNINGKNSNTLNNKYWFINSINEQYYVWYNVDYLGVDPRISNKIGIEVHIKKGYSSEQIAQVSKTSLDLTGKFLTNIDKDTLIISNVVVGSAEISKPETSDFEIFTIKDGKNRELLVTLKFEYDENSKINSIERL